MCNNILVTIIVSSRRNFIYSWSWPSNGSL